MEMPGSGGGSGEDGVDEEYYWRKIFKSIPIISVVIYSLVFVLGTLGNGAVIFRIFRIFRIKMPNARRQTPDASTVWFLNLAVADFLATAILPLAITHKALECWNYSAVAIVENYWPFGWFMCQMNRMVFFLNMYASIFTLVLISVEKCVRVACPEWWRNHHTVRNASWLSLGIWVLALALSIPQFIFVDFVASVDEDIWCDTFQIIWFRDHFNYGVWIITNFLVGFLVPFTVIVSCYSVTCYRHIKNPNLAPGSFKIIASVISIFVLCWAPFHIIRLIDVVYYLDYSLFDTLGLVLQFGHPITHALALFNSCLNPLVYAVFWRKDLDKAFTEGCGRNTPKDPAAAHQEMLPMCEIQGKGPAAEDPSP